MAKSSSKIVPFFGAGLQGKSPNITAQKRINCYYEIQKEADRTKVSIMGTPGLELFKDFGDTAVRGMHTFIGNERLYAVHRGTLWELDGAGGSTNRGTLLTTSSRVSMADNGTQICIVDGTYGYTYNTSTTTFAQISDGDFPSSPQTVCFNNGRFLVNKGSTGRFYGSDLYDGTSWDALNFATAESNPDNLSHVVAYHGSIGLLGEFSTEFWQDTGSAGFPYARIPGATAEWGLAARWSVARFMDTYAFLARNPTGEVLVAKLNGYAAERISNFELEHLLNQFSSLSGATAFGYMLGGHPMYELNAGGQTWLYDGATDIWSQLKSKNLDRHRAEIHVNFNNYNYVSDYTNGRIYRLKSDVYTDNGDEISLELQGRHIFKNGETVRLNTFELNMETGLGLATGQGSDPQAMLKLSKDYGHSFGNEIFASIGPQGEYNKRAVWRRLGSGRDIVVNVKITDPVKRVITGATLSVS